MWIDVIENSLRYFRGSYTRFSASKFLSEQSNAIQQKGSNLLLRKSFQPPFLDTFAKEVHWNISTLVYGRDRICLVWSGDLRLTNHQHSRQHRIRQQWKVSVLDGDIVAWSKKTWKQSTSIWARLAWEGAVDSPAIRVVPELLNCSSPFLLQTDDSRRSGTTK